MKDQCTILLKTHSSYSHLWPIINHLIQSLPNVIVLVDDDAGHNFEHSVIRYDPALRYTKRLEFALSKIMTDKVLLIHDVDLILNLDLSKLSTLLDLFDANNIDRLSLGVFNGQEIVRDDNNVFCRLTPHMSRNFMTPFDYAPSIYRRQKLLDLCRNFDETYPNFELSQEVQDYVTRNFKSFGLQKTRDNNLVYHRGFVYTKEFNFLHITVKGKFLPMHLYYDLQQIVENLIVKYDLHKYIETNHTHEFISKNVL